jgi:hypothetical protein
MKFKKHQYSISLGLSTLLALSFTAPSLSAISSLNPSNQNLSSFTSLDREILLAQWNFSSRYGSAPHRRTRGFRRGGCLAPGTQAISILPLEEGNTIVDIPPNNSNTSAEDLEKTSDKLEIIEMESDVSEVSGDHNGEKSLIKNNLKQNLEDEIKPDSTNLLDNIDHSEHINFLTIPENPLPEDTENEVNTQDVTDRVWFTADEYPSVYFYLPENWAKNAEFVLYNNKDEVVYSASLVLPGEASQSNPRPAGVIEVNLNNRADDDLKPLEVGVEYLWEVQVLCDEINRSGNPTVNGWIQKIDKESQEALNQELETVTDPSEKNQIYVDHNIWYSLLANIYEDSNLEDWNNALKQVGTEEIINSPILGSVTIKETYKGDFPPI